MRELAAYMLDHQRFSGVPYTQLVVLEEFSGDSGADCYEEAKTLISTAKTQCVTSDDSTCGSQLSTTDSVQSCSQAESKKLKIGMLQRFQENVGPLENYSSSLFSADEVHKIAILDLRLLNLDRNLCNVLVSTQN